MDQLARLNSYIAELFPRGLKIAMEQLPLAKYNFVVWVIALVVGVCLFIGALRYHPSPSAQTTARRKESPTHSKDHPAEGTSATLTMQEELSAQSDASAKLKAAKKAEDSEGWVEVRQRKPKRE